MASQTIKKSVLVAFLLCIAAAAAFGYLDRVADISGMSRVSKANADYLETAFDRSLAGFLILSGIKSGLAVIEGSEVGIGFNLEIGDIVQSVYDYIDVAWKAALAGGTILLITKLSLDAVSLIDHWCLSLMFLTLTTYVIFVWFLPKYIRTAHAVREASIFLIVLSMAFYFILPASISGASFLSKRITQPIMQETQAGFEEINKEFSPARLNQHLFADDRKEESIFSSMDFKARYEKTKERIKYVGAYFKDKTRHIAVLTLKLIAGYVFDCIIFPLTFFVILYVFTRGLVNFLNRSLRFERRAHYEMS